MSGSKRTANLLTIIVGLRKVTKITSIFPVVCEYPGRVEIPSKHPTLAMELQSVSIAWQATTMPKAAVQRTEPPSDGPNNQDVFIWALYLLGGSDRDVDVEEIYLKCFELAPARLGWRTHPELPDYKKAAKALQSVEASTHVGLLHKPHKFSRRLTLIGIHWVESYREILEENYSHKPVMASKSKNSYERVRQDIIKSRAWQSFEEFKVVGDIADAAAALQCSPASPHSTWQSRINNLKRASDVLQDPDLMEFAEYVDNKFVVGENNDN
jgi:hypothetical protein